jgi:cytoskeletal protein CcmA (bactofilin family)
MEGLGDSLYDGVCPGEGIMEMNENTQSVPSTNLSNPSSAARTASYLGPELKIRGQIDGDEDLNIDGKMEGPISLGDNRLTLGPGAQILGDIESKEVVVFGDVKGNLTAQDRLDVRKNASVIGDLTTSRITIEDGAHVKGAIQINWDSPRSSTDPHSDLALAVKNFRMKRAADAEK